ncbi:MAG: hypothetical protein LBG86_00195 [Puniceicoccales bacterium]|nr:hypothetical protein [Puniceicoccales bacterium]
MIIFRREDFFHDAESIHLTFDETWVYSSIQDCDVRKRLDEFVDYAPIFSDTLDDMCENVVGRTLFRLIGTKSTIRMNGRKIKLSNYEGKSSVYSRKDFAIMSNRSMFDDDGNGLSSRQYYYVNEKMELNVKSKNISMALFHEFCHALHDMEKISEITEIGELHRSNEILGAIWDNAEELRTITGCIYGTNYDPICDHCFDLCDSIRKEKPFNPRYSHRGYDSETSSRDEERERRRLIAYYSESQKIMNGWKKYVL